MTLDEMKAECKAVTRQCIDIYNTRMRELGRPEFDRQVNFEWKLRGRTAGTAFCSVRKPLVINLNVPLMLTNDNFIEDTVPHEVAHLLAHHYKRSCSPHGATWQMMMRLLGREPERLHNYATAPARYEAKVTYACDCGPVHKVGTKLHNEIQSGKGRICRNCRAQLVRHKPKVNRLAEIAKRNAAKSI